MKNNEAAEHEEQLPQSNSPRRKKPYVAPKITLLKLDRAKAQLIARALTGDREAEDQLEASVNDTDNLAATRTKP
jgi:hypothetical protein